MMPHPKASFGPLSLIFAPKMWLVKLDSPYNRLMKGASGKYAGEIVKSAGTVIRLNVKVAGSVVVESTIPGRMLPTTEPIPGKFDAAPKFPFSPDGVPSWLTNGGAMALPVNPKFTRRADERKLPERLSAHVARWSSRAKQRAKTCQGRRTAHPYRRRDHRRSGAQQTRTEEQLRIRQIKARQILWIVHLDATIPDRTVEQFQVVVYPDVEAQGCFHYVYVPRIAIKIAVRDAERKLTLPYRIPIIDRK